MKKGRFTEEQIIGILQEAAAGMKVPEVCRKYGISDCTFYTWRTKYSDMTVPDIKRMKALETENNKLKTLVADLTLEITAIKAMLQKKW